MKKYFLLLFILLWVVKLYATPNNQMSIAPSAVDNTVIAASDENDRNTEVSSKYNAHSHTDNPLNIGDGTAGNKTINANNADTAKPYIEFQDEGNRWIITADGGPTGVSIHSNAVYIHGSAARLYIGQPDGGCSSCGVDAAGTTWTCSDIACP